MDIIRQSDKSGYNQMLTQMSTKRARAEQAMYAIPERDFRSWIAQRDTAKARGIPFHFSLLAWRLWWQCQLARLGPDAKRGRARDSYVMARIGDRGAYETDNVQCITLAQNSADQPRETRDAARIKAAHTRQSRTGAHLRERGKHPRSKPVITPLGRFASVALAADAHGITRQGAHHHVTRGSKGWHYETDGKNRTVAARADRMATLYGLNRIP